MFCVMSGNIQAGSGTGYRQAFIITKLFVRKIKRGMASPSPASILTESLEIFDFMKFVCEKL